MQSLPTGQIKSKTFGRYFTLSKLSGILEVKATQNVKGHY